MALPVNFDADSAGRIFRAVRTVERGNRDQKPLTFRRVTEAPTQRAKVRIVTFTGSWENDSAKVVTFRNKTSTPNTVVAYNLFADVDGSTATAVAAIAYEGTAWYAIETEAPAIRLATFSGAWATSTFKTITLVDNSATVSALNVFYPITSTSGNTSFCAAAESKGTWLLISVPLKTATAIGVSATATILRIAPEHTVLVTALTSQSTSKQTFITGISAVLNTANCSITLTLATSSITLSSSGTTTSFIALSTAATATVSVIESTQVLSFLRFQD